MRVSIEMGKTPGDGELTFANGEKYTENTSSGKDGQGIKSFLME